ncbi:MAG: DNA repair protein RadA [Clostridia bacterium]|nr:DNA repair protein RadA [Clostridia bacterium]
MAKVKSVYACTACGYETPRWVGRCPGCGAWNTLEESISAVQEKAPAKLASNQRPGTGAVPLLLKDIPEDTALRTPTGISELDRVLGGGIVEGGLMLIGGDPGIGKSTLLLQVCANLAEEGKRILYISGEESARQIKLRARRLEIETPGLYVLAENALDAVETRLREIQPDVAVVDSIQTMYRPEMASAPGSVSQIRESTSLLMRICKETGTAMFVVGHVTKDGAIAGPRMLEHMVDVVLYFEGDRQQDYRLLRAVKNRFGSVNELGVFRMTGKGMQVVPNPSEELLSHRAKGASGSTVFCGMEGSRPLLCDVQALASQSYLNSPRRTVNGADPGRIAMLLAVLEKRAGQRSYNQDVYINVAGGLELSEPAADLALCVAVASSLKDQAVGAETAVMGEVGLAGEIRTVPQCERRVAECARLGFTTLVVPRENARRLQKVPEGVRILGVDTVMQALSVLF